MYTIFVLSHFRKQLKRLSKKYHHLKKEVILDLKKFDKTRHQFLGHNLYKMRVKSADIAKGKAKSFRLVVFILEVEGFIIPVAIYFKGDKTGITLKEINDHLEKILIEARELGITTRN